MRILVIKINPTIAQQEKIKSLSLAGCYSKVVVRPCFFNENILVKLVDNIGRESFRELNKNGELFRTTYYFNT